jgi:hypothetical protein
MAAAVIREDELLETRLFRLIKKASGLPGENNKIVILPSRRRGLGAFYAGSSILPAGKIISLCMGVECDYTEMFDKDEAGHVLQVLVPGLERKCVYQVLAMPHDPSAGWWKFINSRRARGERANVELVSKYHSEEQKWYPVVRTTLDIAHGDEILAHYDY